MIKSLLSKPLSSGEHGRPVMTKDAVVDLAKHIISLSVADHATVELTHTAQVITRVANGQVLSGDDGDELTLFLPPASVRRTVACPCVLSSIKWTNPCCERW